jgi:hypothetical protein
MNEWYIRQPRWTREWYKRHPPSAQKRIDAYPPDKMYRLLANGLIVPIHRYVIDDDGTCDTCVVKVLKINNPQYQYHDISLSVAFSELEMVRV